MKREIKRPHHKVLRSQQGVALITVLMVFAIAALLATKIITAKTLDTQRITGQINRTQAYYYARAAEELAILVLKNDWQNDRDNNRRFVDDLNEDWALANIPFEIDSFGGVLIRIVDLNRFYNINNLFQADKEVNDNEVARFKQLLTELDIDPEITENLRDWLDEDDQVDGYASESGDYSRLDPAYRAANRRLADVSELRLIEGFNAEVMTKLLPHIAVIPISQIVPINVNTATDYALTTLQRRTNQGITGITLSGAQDIISERINESFENTGNVGSPNGPINDLEPAPIRNQNSAGGSLGSVLAVSSNYYEINIQSSYAGHTTYLTTVVYQRSGDNFVVISRQETDNSHRFSSISR